MHQKDSDFKIGAVPETKNVGGRTLEQGPYLRRHRPGRAKARFGPPPDAWELLHAILTLAALLGVYLRTDPGSCHCAACPTCTATPPPSPVGEDALPPLPPSLDGWVPDLTDYGVEPNPGPVTFDANGPVRAKKKKKTKGSATPKQSGLRKAVVSAAKFALAPRAQSESIGKRIGGWVGDMAQKAILAITGMGDYTVSRNTLVNGGTPPAFAQGRHRVKVCHREFVFNVLSSTGFVTQGFNINPKTSLFPWLAQIALSFEQFRVLGMVVEFKSTSADAIASTNTALGSVILATQYNVLAPAFTSQQQMESYEYCTSCKPSQSMIHPIECAPALTSVEDLYMDSGSTGDARFENLGTVYVATVGQQAASVVIGELWVSYEIDLIKPKLFDGLASAGLTAHFVSSSTVAISSLLLSPLGALPAIPTVGSNLPVTIVTDPTNANATKSSLSFAPWVSGTFLILLSYAVGNAAAWTVQGGASARQNGVIVAAWSLGTSIPSFPGILVANSSNRTIAMALVWQCSGNNPNLNSIVSLFGVSGSPVDNANATDLWITQLSAV